MVARFEDAGILADGFLAAVTGDFRKSLIDGDDAGVGVGDRHAVARQFEHLGRLPQGFLAAPDRGDVVDDHGELPDFRAVSGDPVMAVEFDAEIVELLTVTGQRDRPVALDPPRFELRQHFANPPADELAPGEAGNRLESRVDVDEAVIAGLAFAIEEDLVQREARGQGIEKPAQVSLVDPRAGCLDGSAAMVD
jgi:hypothetical protein